MHMKQTGHFFFSVRSNVLDIRKVHGKKIPSISALGNSRTIVYFLYQFICIKIFAGLNLENHLGQAQKNLHSLSYSASGTSVHTNNCTPSNIIPFWKLHHCFHKLKLSTNHTSQLPSKL